MKRQGRKKLSQDNLYSNARRRIIDALDHPLSISQISEKIKMNRGTLKHHLSILINNNILKKEQQKEIAGKPVLYFKIINLKAENLLCEFLEVIHKNGSITLSKLKEENLISKFGLCFSIAELDGLIDKRLYLTDKGKMLINKK